MSYRYAEGLMGAGDVPYPRTHFSEPYPLAMDAPIAWGGNYCLLGRTNVGRAAPYAGIALPASSASLTQRLDVSLGRLLVCGQFSAADFNGTSCTNLAMTTDDVNWTNLNSPASTRSAATDGTSYFAACTDGATYISDGDGSWTDTSCPFSVAQLHYFDSRIVAIRTAVFPTFGNPVYAVYDGSWSSSALTITINGASRTLYQILDAFEFGGEFWIAATWRQTALDTSVFALAKTSDLSTWSEVTMPAGWDYANDSIANHGLSWDESDFYVNAHYDGGWAILQYDGGLWTTLATDNSTFVTGLGGVNMQLVHTPTDYLITARDWMNIAMPEASVARNNVTLMRTTGGWPIWTPSGLPGLLELCCTRWPRVGMQTRFTD